MPQQMTVSKALAYTKRLVLRLCEINRKGGFKRLDINPIDRQLYMEALGVLDHEVRAGSALASRVAGARDDLTRFLVNWEKEEH
jgi:hypothetical protein